LTSAAKLETQNGIMNSRNATQNGSRSRGRPPALVALINSAKPMIRLRPSDVAHRRGFGSQ
jgi:hypothetical protein